MTISNASKISLAHDFSEMTRGLDEKTKAYVLEFAHNPVVDEFVKFKAELSQEDPAEVRNDIVKKYVGSLRL